MDEPIPWPTFLWGCLMLLLGLVVMLWQRRYRGRPAGSASCQTESS